MLTSWFLSLNFCGVMSPYNGFLCIQGGFLEKLNSNEFVALSRLMEGFILDTEQICGRKSMSLRGALQSQANKFVNRFHEERKTKLRYLCRRPSCSYMHNFNSTPGKHKSFIWKHKFSLPGSLRTLYLGGAGWTAILKHNSFQLF